MKGVIWKREESSRGVGGMVWVRRGERRGVRCRLDFWLQEKESSGGEEERRRGKRKVEGGLAGGTRYDRYGEDGKEPGMLDGGGELGWMWSDQSKFAKGKEVGQKGGAVAGDGLSHIDLAKQIKRVSKPFGAELLLCSQVVHCRQEAKQGGEIVIERARAACIRVRVLGGFGLVEQGGHLGVFWN